MQSGKELDANTNFGIIHYGKKRAHIVPSNPYINKNFINTSYIRSSIQVALLGHITPNLRAVSVECKEKEIKLSFYYDNIPCEDERELANLSDTKFISDFPTSIKTNFEIIHLSRHISIPKVGMLVYLRYEP